MENTTAAKIDAAMDANGVSRHQLALRVGIPYTTLKRAMDGHRDFKVNEVLRIADTLGIDARALIPETGAA